MYPYEERLMWQVLTVTEEDQSAQRNIKLSLLIILPGEISTCKLIDAIVVIKTFVEIIQWTVIDDGSDGKCKSMIISE